MWKQDLAKLKQQLGEDPVPPRPAVKPVPQIQPPQPIEDEDALFLRSMGQPKAPLLPVGEPSHDSISPVQLRPQAPKEESDAFARAMSGMKGMKPIDTSDLPRPKAVAPAPAPPAVTGTPNQQLLANVLAASEETRPLNDFPPPSPEALKPKGPVLIHLAAGMAIDVDGVLDLRNHTLSDARERLKERVEDAGHLGWRCMHVILGPSEALKQGFLVFLTTTAAKPVARYAQAPIPMGGQQAWIVYLGGPTA